jgi:predicted lysophospholipase L1 biosynthesis ABC-type transport system permease subunit
MLEYISVAADPFSILTVVVAPAVLTNALAKLEPGARDREVSAAELTTLQTRAQLLLRALRCFYLGLGLFASSALISIAGSIVVYYGLPSAFQIAAAIGVACGASAVIALVCGCLLMIRETQLAVKGLAYDAKS